MHPTITVRWSLFLSYFMMIVVVAFPDRMQAALGQEQQHHQSSETCTREDKESGACRISRFGRGGSIVADENQFLDDFLNTSQKEETSGKKDTSQMLDQFHIHGWRWHTLSMVRESGRFHQLARRTLEEQQLQIDDVSNNSKKSSPLALKQAADYVIDFNLKGLHRIESQLFFPWLREKLTSIPGEPAVSAAFASTMDQLEHSRVMVSQLGESIKQSLSVACDSSQEPSRRSRAIEAIMEESSQLESEARAMMNVENSLLVPAIAKVVPESEQKTFSNKVLRGLGLLDSRLHLVGMHEAVEESQDPKEMELFEREIPSIPRMMITRWKRNLYEPKANVLDPTFVFKSNDLDD